MKPILLPTAELQSGKCRKCRIILADGSTYGFKGRLKMPAEISTEIREVSR
jgi:hypothetical protein